VRRAKLLTPPSAPPPPGSQFRSGSVPPDDLYAPDHGAGSPYGTSRGQGFGKDSLYTEKMIAMGLYGVVALLQAVGALVPDTAAAAEATPGGPWAQFAGSLVGLAVMWLVFFTRELWMKYCCASCLGLSIIGSIIGVFALAGLAPMLSQQMGMSAQEAGMLPAVMGFVVVLVILRVAIDAWILSIIWRDIQTIREY
jgi:hypothetical protein